MIQARALVDRYIAAFANKDLDAIRQLYHPGATVEDPVGSETIQGIDDIIRFYTHIFELDVLLKPDGALRVAGNSVAFPFIGEAPTQSIEVVDVFDLDETGKIVAMRAYWGEINIHPHP